MNRSERSSAPRRADRLRQRAGPGARRRLCSRPDEAGGARGAGRGDRTPLRAGLRGIRATRARAPRCGKLLVHGSMNVTTLEVEIPATAVAVLLAALEGDEKGTMDACFIDVTFTRGGTM